MSRLILVRHAQASFFSKNYDQLSSLGEAQARALGEYWLRLGIGFDEVIVGPRQRHSQTEGIVRAVYSGNGKRWPEPQLCPELDEHAVDQLLGEPLEQLLQRQPSLGPLVADYRNSTIPEQTQRAFQRLFEAMCHLWCACEPGTESIESWDSFRSRVETGLRRILERPGKNRTIAVFTSVGNITAVLGAVLKCTPTQAFELGWRLKNCSVTELIFSGNRITLDQFNTVAHLPDPGTWTFR
ncbi:MAG: histidine phosphatase family protein [Pirellulales bacterium]